MVKVINVKIYNHSFKVLDENYTGQGKNIVEARIDAKKQALAEMKAKKITTECLVVKCVNLSSRN